MRHDLIKTGDADVFTAITDGHGVVVLSYCRRCREGENTLAAECPGAARARAIDLRNALWRGHHCPALGPCESCKAIESIGPILAVYEAAMLWRETLTAAVQAGLTASDRERFNTKLLRRLDDLERACDAAKESK